MFNIVNLKEYLRKSNKLLILMAQIVYGLKKFIESEINNTTPK